MLSITTDDTHRFQVRNDSNVLLASFLRHPDDTTIGLQIYHRGTSNYTQQRHLPEDPEARERIERIFDQVPLDAEIEHLKSLHQENAKLWDEKYTTANHDRYAQLTRGGLLREAERNLEIQRDIVSAKMIIHLGISPRDLVQIGG